MATLVVVGGSKGIGSALIHRLQPQYEKIINIDIVKPSFAFPNLIYTKFDLFKNNVSDIKDIVSKADTLIITAGIGTVKPFEDFSEIEIKKIFQINTVSEIEIIALFYPFLLNTPNKKCLIFGSIAGDIVSPLFSLYGASKASINRICESLNIELEKSGSNNRITCVKPISFKGSSFNGGETNLVELSELVDCCINALNTNKTELYYKEDICKDILKRNFCDKHAFGLSSYQYKIDGGRVNNKKTIKIGYLSGTFDLFHIGHLNLIRNAKEKCDYLIVGVHPSGSWKGKETFIPFEERLEIIKSIKFVDLVVEAPDDDYDAWLLYNYDALFVGSDYKGTERFNRYEVLLKDKAEITYFDYTKSTSSSQIRNLIKKGNCR